jgi:hypothetical protein
VKLPILHYGQQQQMKKSNKKRVAVANKMILKVDIQWIFTVRRVDLGPITLRRIRTGEFWLMELEYSIIGVAR